MRGREEFRQGLNGTPAVFLSIGENGLRHICPVSGREKFLYLDWSLNRWFVEARS